ncbi:PTS transporter subunit EIIC [Streptomyces sp. NRRL S-920]|uniref:PTS transporter subunit EIIC n=1 Tax=Streptomyces sp. NRRL S-920 TaxID=1463921 RepID=UPI0022770C0B|nr:PTS transporter subunit EIIC [Streptomyces sp. NRRL S-920]
MSVTSLRKTNAAGKRSRGRWRRTPRSSHSETGFLRRLGEGLALPVAALPAAGLLLRIGQKDLLGGVGAISPAASVVSAVGGAVLGYLPLLFAVGAVFGLQRDRDPHAALAAIVAYLAISHACLQLNPLPSDKLDTPPSQQPYGALTGILAGILTAMLWRRLTARRLPPFAAHAAILVAALLLGAALGLAFPAVNDGLVWLAKQLTAQAVIGGGVFGVLNRVLLLTGLHQIPNTIMWFVAGEYANGVHGDIPGFLVARDPAAGSFTTGFYPIACGALPAAAVAMWRTALPEQRKRTGQLLGTAALMSFCFGVTEPIELLFAFAAWPLYLTHAVLTGTSLALVNALGIKHSFAFSAGALDFGLNFPIATRPILLLPIAAAYAAIYYVLFKWAILRFNLATPGRSSTPEPAEDDSGTGAHRTGPHAPPPGPRGAGPRPTPAFTALSPTRQPAHAHTTEA